MNSVAPPSRTTFAWLLAMLLLLDGRAAAAPVAPVPTPAPAAKSTRPVDRAGYLYTYVEHTSQYRDNVFSFDAYKPFGSPQSHVRPYVDVFANDDTATHGGIIPQTLNDNYAGAALGLQYTDNAGLRLFGQAGATTKIGRVAATPSGGDLRGGAEYYREWGGAQLKRHAYGNFYGDGVYYSRYHDMQFYNQLEVGTEPLHSSHPVDLFVRGVLAMDTHPYYYGNYAEATLGVRFYPFGLHGPTIELDGVAGTYLRANLVPAGVSRSYIDFRPLISYGVSI
ncbi:MAG: hypothetical protein ACYDA5_06795 [Vulcanimicrobiaceae bacterium]